MGGGLIAGFDAEDAAARATPTVMAGTEPVAAFLLVILSVCLRSRRFGPGAGFPMPHPMHKLREFYRQYRQYILTDGLMYGAFLLALALMFIFFR